jgi:hypothetical protein
MVTHRRRARRGLKSSGKRFGDSGRAVGKLFAGQANQSGNGGVMLVSGGASRSRD